MGQRSNQLSLPARANVFNILHVFQHFIVWLVFVNDWVADPEQVLAFLGITFCETPRLQGFQL